MRTAQGMLGQGFDTTLDTSTQSAIERALSGKSSFVLDRDAISSDYMKEVGLPMFREFDQSVTPRIAAGFRKTGGLFSNSRGTAIQRALEGLQTNLTSGLAGRQWQGTTLEASLAEGAANRSMTALPFAEQFAGRNISRAGTLTQAASPFQNYYQSILDVKKADWERTRPYNSPYNSMAMNFLNLPATETVGFQGSQGTDWGSMLGMIGGGAAGGYLGSAKGSAVLTALLKGI